MSSPADSPLPSTVEGITADCPQFRILVVGKTGCGKSSLINKVFGVGTEGFAQVSHCGPGEAKINTGFCHPGNNRFILHDSEGFEPGEEAKFNVVKRFIEERNGMPLLKDKLHAIWICISVPVAGDRVAESGVEQLVEINRGAVPLIFVFTKYDMLVTSTIRREGLADKKLDVKQVWLEGERRANNAFNELCMVPLTKVFREVTVTKVSCQLRYNDTIKELIAATDREIQRRTGASHAEPRAFNFAAAQRMNTDVKVEASVDIGKLKYWSRLLSNTDFTGKKLRQCLDVIHRDIVSVWNIRNSDYLADDDFKAKMIVLADDLVTSPNTPTHSGGLTVATVAAIAGAASSPAGIIILSVGVAILFAEWILNVYQNTSHNVACIMAYIVDLTIVMHRLSAIEISKERVVSTLQDYARSREIAEVHNDIRTFCGRFASSGFGSTDNTLEEIIRLLREHHVQVSPPDLDQHRQPCA